MNINQSEKVTIVWSHSHENPSISHCWCQWPGFQETWERYIDGLLVWKLSGRSDAIGETSWKCKADDMIIRWQDFMTHDILKRILWYLYFFRFWHNNTAATPGFFAHAEGLSTESGAKESSIMKTMGSDWDDDGRSTGILMVINGDLNCDLMVISGN